MALGRRTLIAAMTLLSFVACGGGDPTGPGGNGDDRSIKDAPSFSSDIQEILQRRGCTAAACHLSGQGDLTLGNSASANRAALVGVTSPNSGEVYVIPGDAQNSYLVKKLEGRQGAGNGARMPLSASALDNIDLTNIKNWINDGAPNN